MTARTRCVERWHTRESAPSWQGLAIDPLACSRAWGEPLDRCPHMPRDAYAIVRREPRNPCRAAGAMGWAL